MAFFSDPSEVRTPVFGVASIFVFYIGFEKEAIQNANRNIFKPLASF